jgi:hypothetical protein
MTYATVPRPHPSGMPPALVKAVGAFRMDGPPESNEAGGKGPARYYGRFIPNLPLRGKLGWMTPRSRCENDAGYETRLLEAPDPKRGPHFFRPPAPAQMIYVSPRPIPANPNTASPSTPSPNKIHKIPPPASPSPAQLPPQIPHA